MFSFLPIISQEKRKIVVNIKFTLKPLVKDTSLPSNTVTESDIYKP